MKTGRTDTMGCGFFGAIVAKAVWSEKQAGHYSEFIIKNVFERGEL